MSVLQFNKLQALPAGVFDQLVELDRLELSQNQLKFLPVTPNILQEEQ